MLGFGYFGKLERTIGITGILVILLQTYQMTVIIPRPSQPYIIIS